MIMRFCWQSLVDTPVPLFFQKEKNAQYRISAAINYPFHRQPSIASPTCQAFSFYTSLSLQPFLLPRIPAVRKQRKLTITSAAPALAVASSAVGQQGFLVALTAAWHTSPASVMLAAGALLLGTCLSIFLLAAIPGILAMRRTAHAMEQLLHTIRQEVPDTASVLRLSGMELADCIEEVSLLSNNLTQGVRSTARVVSAAEEGVRFGVDMAGKTVTGYVVPALKSHVPEARDALQAALEQRAKLDYTATTVREVSNTTKGAIQRVRMGLAALGLAHGAAGAVQQITQRVVLPRPTPPQTSNGQLQ